MASRREAIAMIGRNVAIMTMIGTRTNVRAVAAGTNHQDTDHPLAAPKREGAVDRLPRIPPPAAAAAVAAARPIHPRTSAKNRKKKDPKRHPPKNNHPHQNKTRNLMKSSYPNYPAGMKPSKNGRNDVPIDVRRGLRLVLGTRPRTIHLGIRICTRRLRGRRRMKRRRWGEENLP